MLSVPRMPVVGQCAVGKLYQRRNGHRRNGSEMPPCRPSAYRDAGSVEHPFHCTCSALATRRHRRQPHFGFTAHPLSILDGKIVESLGVTVVDGRYPLVVQRPILWQSGLIPSNTHPDTPHYAHRTIARRARFVPVHASGDGEWFQGPRQSPQFTSADLCRPVRGRRPRSSMVNAVVH